MVQNVMVTNALIFMHKISQLKKQYQAVRQLRILLTKIVHLGSKLMNMLVHITDPEHQ